jgi:predicted flap endonuclease-1-like 5' DNA nuclease
MAKLIDIEGIGDIYAEKLRAVGVRSTNALLSLGATRKGRQTLADKSGIGEALILRWVNHADLFRIKGVGEEYSDLLEAAGVDTVVELAQRHPANLREQVAAANAERKRVRQLPTPDQVKGWVKQAKRLKRAVEY